MTIQDQYANSIRQTQDAWAGVVDSFTDNVQKTFQHSPTPFAAVDPSTAIDQYFDFWAKAIEVQRDLTKQLTDITVAVGEKVRTQTESAGAAVREQGEAVLRNVRQHAETVQATAREQAAQAYAELTKAELQDLLAARGLPKTGAVDELRERLIADDQK